MRVRSVAIAGCVGISALAVPLIAFILLSQLTLLFCPRSWRSVRVGDPEEKIMSSLGRPAKTCTQDVRCSLVGYAQPPFMAAKRTLVFRGCDKAFFVFLGEGGVVIATWWGNS